MAKIPLILHASVAVQVVPVIAWAFSRRRTRAATAIVVAVLVSLLGDYVGRVMAVRFHNNNIVTYIDFPMMTICFLYALREWQTTPKERRVLTLGSIGYLIACVLLVAFVEDVWTFDIGVVPLSAAMLLVTGMWTLLRNSTIAGPTPLRSRDWFLVSLGLSLYGAVTALASPIGRILLGEGKVELFMVLWQIRALFVIASYGLMSWGIFRGPSFVDLPEARDA